MSKARVARRGTATITLDAVAIASYVKTIGLSLEALDGEHFTCFDNDHEEGLRSLFNWALQTCGEALEFMAVQADPDLAAFKRARDGALQPQGGAA